MAPNGSPSSHLSLRLASSYALDWIVLVAVVVVAGFLGRIEPNKRPFALNDANISFPFTTDETVPTWLLVVLCGLAPAVIILIISVVLVPGGTVPRNTPLGLIWKRKLWELHVGWLGLLLAVGSAFFFISGIKNMCGKPRPDLLSRCDPDLANAALHRVGGFAGEDAAALLYAGSICRQTDRHKLDDGFRSYPSGHAAASAAGLIYLSLYLASKFAVTIPFVVANPRTHADASTHAAFPSRPHGAATASASSSDPYSPLTAKGSDEMQHNTAVANVKIQSLRRQAAAPPIYLLAMTLAPFCVAIFISASRWFDFRHHGFDILFGFLIGTACAIYSFRYYHLPIMAGAGWAWGPRSADRAFWAGVGRLGYVGHSHSADLEPRPDRADLGESGGPAPRHPAQQSAASGPAPPMGGAANHRAAPRHYQGLDEHDDYHEPAQYNMHEPPPPGPFHDLEMGRMEQHPRRPVGAAVAQQHRAPPSHSSVAGRAL